MVLMRISVDRAKVVLLRNMGPRFEHKESAGGKQGFAHTLYPTQILTTRGLATTITLHDLYRVGTDITKESNLKQPFLTLCWQCQFLRYSAILPTMK